MLIEKEYSRTLLLTVTILANFFNPLLGAAVNVALPEIGKEFQIGAVQLSWITMTYLLAAAVFLVPLGKAGDILGRKKMFLYGNLVLGIASLICGISTKIEYLIITRFIQGIGGAMMIATAMAIIISAFPKEERGKVIGMNVSAVYLGLSASPIIGGVLTEELSWRSLFIISGVISLIIFTIVLTKIKAEWKENDHDKFDWTGALIYIPSMTLLMYGFSQLPKISAVILALIGLLGIVLFVFVELKVKYPLLNMKLFIDNKVFAGSNLSALINYAATFAVGFMLSLYLQYIKGLSPSQAGMILITQPILMALVAMFSGRLSDKIPSRYLASSGMAVSVIGLIMLIFIAQDTTQLYIIMSMVVIGLGIGLFSSPNTNQVMSSVEKKHYGLASATLGTMRSTGMMFSMAIASLSIHLFVGNKSVVENNMQDFINSSRLVFLVFSIFCIVGVFLSFVNKQKCES